MKSRITLLTVALGFMFISTASATKIAVPQASLALFKTPRGEPKRIEIHVSSSKGATTFGQGTLTISSNGAVSGVLNFTRFASDSTKSTQVKEVRFTGKISRPRLVRQDWYSDRQAMAADYLVDFSATTITTKIKGAPSYRMKGVLIFRYIKDYRYQEGSGVIDPFSAEDESYLDQAISVFGPNGEAGSVLRIE
jgi:hypothetical protein